LVQSVEVPVDAHGNTGYGGMCKAGQREAFAHAALEVDRSKGPVVYLDGPDAALTRHLLERGVDSDRLVPVNRSAVVAREIERRCPGVRCRVDDICCLASEAAPDAFDVVWFDMCGTDFGEFSVEQLVACAHVKFFTVSSRQLLCMDQAAALCNALAASAEQVVERSIYTGRSGKGLNMVHVVSRTNPSKRRRSRVQPAAAAGGELATDEPSAVSASEGVGIGTVVRIPLMYWGNDSFVDRYGYKVFDGHLIGAVQSHVSNSAGCCRISFQLQHGGTLLCAMRYNRATVEKFALR
tara:strand:+ start:4527 stop:5411 length:885 start_codon:yes stop_codon:yes gene_type:complete